MPHIDPRRKGHLFKVQIPQQEQSSSKESTVYAVYRGAIGQNAEAIKQAAYNKAIAQQGKLESGRVLYITQTDVEQVEESAISQANRVQQVLQPESYDIGTLFEAILNFLFQIPFSLYRLVKSDAEEKELARELETFSHSTVLEQLRFTSELKILDQEEQQILEKAYELGKEIAKVGRGEEAQKKLAKTLRNEVLGNEIVAIPVGFGEKERYAPAILLFRDNGQQLTLFSLAPEGTEAKVVSATDLQYTLPEEPNQFLDAVFLKVLGAQPKVTQAPGKRKEPSTPKVAQAPGEKSKKETTSEKEFRNLTSVIVNAASNQQVTVQPSKRKEKVQSSQDPTKLFLNVLNLRRIEKQQTPYTKVEFFQNYVEQLLQTVQERPFLLTQKEKDRLLISAKLSVLQLQHHIENSLLLEEGMQGQEARETARSIVAPLLSLVNQKVEEQENAIQRGIKGERALEVSQKPLSSSLVVKAPKRVKKKAEVSTAAQPTLLTSEERRLIATLKTAPSKEAIESIRIRANVLIESKEFLHAKRLLMQTMQALPAPGASFWSSLQGAELAETFQNLSSISKLFGESMLKLGDTTLSPSEAAEYNIVFTTLLLELTSKIIAEKQRQFYQTLGPGEHDITSTTMIEQMKQNLELRKLYTYAFSNLPNFIEPGYSENTKKFNMAIRLMKLDPTLLTGGQVELEARIRAARAVQEKMAEEINEQELPSRSVALSNLGVIPEAGVETQEAIRAEQGIFDTDAEGHKFLVPPEMKEVTRHLMMVRVLEDFEKAVVPHRTGYLQELGQGAIGKDKQKRSALQKMGRIHLTVVNQHKSIKQVTRETPKPPSSFGPSFGFAESETAKEADYIINTAARVTDRSEEKSYDFHPNREGRRKFLGKVPDRMIPPDVTSNGKSKPYDPLFVGGNRGLENPSLEEIKRNPSTHLPPEVEYRLLGLLQLDRATEQSRAFKVERYYIAKPISALNAVAFALENPDLLGDQVVRDRLYMILHQPGLMRQAMIDQPERFREFAKALKEEMEKPNPDPWKQVFLQDLALQMGAVAKGLDTFPVGSEELPVRPLLEKLSWKLPKITAKPQVYQEIHESLPAPNFEEAVQAFAAKESSMEQKLYAYQLLVAARHQENLEQQSAKDFKQLYSAYLILKKSPEVSLQPALEHDLVLWAESSFFPVLEGKLNDETFQKDFLNAVAKTTHKNLNPQQTGSPFSFQLGSKEINLLSGEGVEFEIQIKSDPAPLPLGIVQHPDFQKIFGAEFHPIAKGKRIQEGIEYQWKVGDQTYKARLFTLSGEVQLIQKRKNEEFVYLAHPTRSESFLELAKRSQKLLRGEASENALEKAIALQGVWASKNRAYVALQNQDLRKDVISLQRNSNGTISSAKFGKRYMVEPPQDLALPVAPDRAYFFSDSKGGTIKEVYLRDKGISLVKSGELWRLKGEMRDWIWDTRSNIQLERRYGKNYREWMLPLINFKRGAREYWIWPNHAKGSFKRGGAIGFSPTGSNPITMKVDSKGLSGPTSGYLYLAYAAAAEAKWGLALYYLKELEKKPASPKDREAIANVAQLFHQMQPTTTRQVAFALKLQLTLARLERRLEVPTGSFTRNPEELNLFASHYLSNEKSHRSRLHGDGLLLHTQEWADLKIQIAPKGWSELVNALIEEGNKEGDLATELMDFLEKGAGSQLFQDLPTKFREGEENKSARERLLVLRNRFQKLARKEQQAYEQKLKLLVQQKDWKGLEATLLSVTSTTLPAEVEQLSRSTSRAGQMNAGDLVSVLLDQGGLGVHAARSLKRVQQKEGIYPNRELVIGKFYPLLLALFEEKENGPLYNALQLEASGGMQVERTRELLLSLVDRYRKQDPTTQEELKQLLRNDLLPMMQVLGEMQALLAHKEQPIPLPLSMYVSDPLGAASLIPILGPVKALRFMYLARQARSMGFNIRALEAPMRLLQGDVESQHLFEEIESRDQFYQGVIQESPVGYNQVMINHAVRQVNKLEDQTLYEQLKKAYSAYEVLLSEDTEADQKERKSREIPQRKKEAMQAIQKAFGRTESFSGESNAKEFFVQQQEELLSRAFGTGAGEEKELLELPDVQVQAGPLVQETKLEVAPPRQDPVRIADFQFTEALQKENMDWEKNFFKPATPSDWGAGEKKAYFNSPENTPPMEKAFDQEIQKGLESQGAHWEAKYSHSLNMDKVSNLQNTLKKKIKEVHQKKLDAKREILDLARQHADKLGIQGDLSYLSRIGERKLMGKLLELYRDGEIDRRLDKADAQELANSIGKYATYTVQLQRYGEARSLAAEMIENKKQLIYPGRILPVWTTQEDANQAKNWLLKSQRLHEILTTGADPRRYEAETLRKEIIALAKTHKEALKFEGSLENLTTEQEKEIVQKFLEFHRNGELKQKLEGNIEKQFAEKLDKIAQFSEAKKRLYRFVEVQNAWSNRQLSLDAVENLLRVAGPDTLIPVQTGVGKTSFIFPSVARIALLHGKIPVMVTTAALVRQFQSKLDPRAYLLEYDFTRSKSLEEMKEMVKTLRSLEKEGRYVVTSDASLVALRQRWVDLHRNPSVENLEEIELLNEMNRIFSKQNVAFFGDEDIILDVGYSDNVALDQKEPIDAPIRIVGKALVEALVEDPDLQPFLLEGKLNQVPKFEEKLKALLHKMLDKPEEGKVGFMEKIGWAPIEDKNQREQLIQYLLNKEETPPEAILGKFNLSNPKYKKMAALRRMLTSTLKEAQSTNNALMRGYDKRNGYSVVPLINSSYVPGMGYAGEDELALHSYFQYVSQALKMGEKAFLKEFELQKRRGTTDTKAQKWTEAIETEAKNMGQQLGREVSNYEAFTSSKSLIQQRLDLAESLMQQGKIGKRKKQISFLRPEGFLIGGKGKVASATGDPYEQALVNSKGFLKKEDVPEAGKGDRLSGDTLLKVNTEAPVRALSENPFNNLVRLAKDPNAKAVVNLDFNILENRGEVIAKELAKKVPGRQYIYRQSGTLAPMILNGPDALPIPYRPDLVNPKQAFFILNPDDATGVDFPIPPGEVHVFHDTGSEFYRARQGYGRARQLFQGQDVVPWASPKFLQQIKNENEEPQTVKMGHLLNSLKKKTVEDRKVRHVKALHFHVENPIKEGFSNALATKLATPLHQLNQNQKLEVAQAENRLFEHLEGHYIQSTEINYASEFASMEKKEPLQYALELYQGKLEELQKKQGEFDTAFNAILKNNEHPAHQRVKAVSNQYKSLIAKYEDLVKVYEEAAKPNPEEGSVGQKVRAYHLANLPEEIAKATQGAKSKSVERMEEKRKVLQKSKTLQRTRQQQKVEEKPTGALAPALPQISMALMIDFFTNTQTSVRANDAQLHEIGEGVYVSTKAKALINKSPNRTTNLVHQMLIRGLNNRTYVVFITQEEWANQAAPFIRSSNLRLGRKASYFDSLGWDGVRGFSFFRRTGIEGEKTRPESIRLSKHPKKHDANMQQFVSFKVVTAKTNQLDQKTMIPYGEYSKVYEIAIAKYPKEKKEGAVEKLLRDYTNNPPEMKVQSLGNDRNAGVTLGALDPNQTSKTTFGTIPAKNRELFQRIALGKLAMGNLILSENEWQALGHWAETVTKYGLETQEKVLQNSTEMNGEEGARFLRQLVYAVRGNPEDLIGKKGQSAAERLMALPHEKRMEAVFAASPVEISNLQLEEEIEIE